MRIACLGGGPAALYFSILMMKQDPKHEIVVYERNPRDVTWGFGVVFSDSTMDGFSSADPITHKRITDEFAHWDDIDIHAKGQVITSRGHGFAGMQRLKLLQILSDRARELGAKVLFEHDVTNVDKFLEDHKDWDLIISGDGVNSLIREKYKDEFQTDIDWRPNKFIWLGTEKKFDAFTFYFDQDEHGGLFRAHCYQFMKGMSTFIAECTQETWKRAGLDKATEEQSLAYCEKVFGKHLQGNPLIPNKSVWRNFPRVKNGKWHYRNIVLMGDALHTAHFSIGSGTKLAMEDAVMLADCMAKAQNNVETALDLFETERKPVVESIQRAAQTSMEWFEETERYYDKLDPIQFAFSSLTRSLRITHDNLAVRDPQFAREIDNWYADQAEKQSGVKIPRPTPPMFTPFKLRDMMLTNRVAVSPMCMYSAEDGTVNDWHLVHLGSRAIGGAGLIIAEMTDVSREGRISPGCAGIYKPEHIPAWRRITDFVHRYSDGKIALQLGHAGRKASTKLGWEGNDVPLDSGNWPVIGPSPIPYTPENQVPREMTRADMDQVKEDYLRAANMAEEAGFDMLEVHFAHGYLLSTFLSPLTNRRTDEYGGSLDNRLRYPLEIFQAVRKIWPAHKPMSVRISATDWMPDGFKPDDAVHVALRLKEAGCDIVDVSAGQVVAEQKPVYGRLFQTPFSDRVRLEAGMPTMTVGNLQSYTDINTILAAGRADVCVLARAHLFDPYWTRHAATEFGYVLPQPPQYEAIQRYTMRAR